MSTHTIDPGSDADWPAQGSQSRLRLRPLTALLTIALIAVAGIYGGAELEKRHGTSSAAGGSSNAAFSARGTGGFTGGPGGTTSASRGTSGTVTEVTAKTLYLTSSAGKLVKVSLTSKTTFTRTSATATGGLELGDSATVQGTKNAQGVLVATSVIATAKGVTAAFGAPGGFGGGTGTGTGTSGTRAAAAAATG
jgi:hypothetical protein